MGTAIKTGTDVAKIASKRVVQKAAGATGDFIGKKIADNITLTNKEKPETEIPSQEIPSQLINI